MYLHDDITINIQSTFLIDIIINYENDILQMKITHLSAIVHAKFWIMN